MKVLAIARRELQGIFATASGWLVLAAFLWISGAFWLFGTVWYVDTSMDLVFDPYRSTQLNFSDHLLDPFFNNTTVVLLMLCPALSMRVFAEEYRQHSIELLYTSPVSSAEIVLGKFLGLGTFAAIMLASTAWMPLSLAWWGSPDLVRITTGYASLWLLSAAVLSVGTALSATTRSQVVALVLTFAAAMGLLLAGWFGDDPDSWVGQLSVTAHTAQLARGAIRLSDLVWFTVFVGWMLLAAHQRVESHRWR